MIIGGGPAGNTAATHAARFGAQVTLAGPATLVPAALKEAFPQVRIVHDLKEALKDCDAVMLLRIQHERQTTTHFPSLGEYTAQFGLNAERAAGKPSSCPPSGVKVNSDKLQELAAEHGLTDHLPSLFRWKPEINMTVWKAADASITTPLLDVACRPRRT